MEILITMLCLLGLNAAASVTATDDADKPCTRFEYEYRVIDKLVDLSNQLQEIQRATGDTEKIIKRLQRDVISLKENKKASDGSVYIRWGRDDCPDNGTELVYKGYGAGAEHTHKGGGANDLCLPDHPTWGKGYNDAPASIRGFVYGMEYQMGKDGPNELLSNMFNHDVPCAVCRSNRPTMIMIPGRNECYDSWTLEYEGYLVGGYWNHESTSEYICLDKEPEAIDAGEAHAVGRMLYIVETRCGSLACPPYVNGRELFCAVCTK